MIFQEKINTLTEEEIYILIHVLNSESGGLFNWHPEYFKAIKPERISPTLEKWTHKMKEENRHKMTSIRDKLGC